MIATLLISKILKRVQNDTSGSSWWQKCKKIHSPKGWGSVKVLPWAQGCSKSRCALWSNAYVILNLFQDLSIVYCCINASQTKNSLKSFSKSFCINLGWKDSNLRDGWTKISCLTTWRHPIIHLSHFLFYVLKTDCQYFFNI